MAGRLWSVREGPLKMAAVRDRTVKPLVRRLSCARQRTRQPRHRPWIDRGLGAVAAGVPDCGAGTPAAGAGTGDDTGTAGNGPAVLRRFTSRNACCVDTPSSSQIGRAHV